MERLPKYRVLMRSIYLYAGGTTVDLSVPPQGHLHSPTVSRDGGPRCVPVLLPQQ